MLDPYYRETSALMAPRSWWDHAARRTCHRTCRPTCYLEFTSAAAPRGTLARRSWPMRDHDLLPRNLPIGVSALDGECE